MAFNFADPTYGMGGMGQGMGRGSSQFPSFDQFSSFGPAYANPMFTGSPMGNMDLGQPQKQGGMSSGMAGLLGGGLGMGLGGLLGGGGLWGTPEVPGGVHQAQNFNPQQLSALSHLLSSAPNMGPIVQQMLSGAMNPQESPWFKPSVDQARRELFQDTIPSIASRFSNMGSGGQRSSGFRNALQSAGVDFNSRMALGGAQHGMQLLNMGLNRGNDMLQMGLQPQFSNYYKATQNRRPGVLESMLPALVGAGLSFIPGIGPILGPAVGMGMSSYMNSQ
jgi:hypothetical protein